MIDRQYRQQAPTADDTDDADDGIRLIGPLLAQTSRSQPLQNAAERPVIAAIRAERSILVTSTSRHLTHLLHWSKVKA